MNHSALYKSTFTSLSGRRFKESKITRQQKRNECFQKGRIIAVSPTPKKIKHNIVTDGLNKSGRFLTIPLGSNNDKENLYNAIKDETIKVPKEKTDSIISKIERQQVFLNKFTEWKKQKEIKKFQQRKIMKAKPFVTACFKNPVLSEAINAINAIETKTQCDNSKFKFQIKNYVLLPPAKPAVVNILADKKILKSSENIYKKRLLLNEANAKVNTELITNPQINPLETLNKNVKHKICKPETKTTVHSPIILQNKKNPVKNLIHKAPVNKNKSIQNDKHSRNVPNLFKQPLKSKVEQTKKIHTLKRPPIFLREHRKTSTKMNETSTNNNNPKIEMLKFLDTSGMPNSILETTDFDATKCVPSVFATSTLRKHAGDSLPLSLDLEESIIKNTTEIKNISLENDLRPILSSSDENTPVNKTKEKKPRDFHLSKTKKINESISESNNKATPTRRISERLSTKKRRTCCSGDYLIDIWSRTPVPTPVPQQTRTPVPQQTPTQSNNIDEQNYYYMSPQVAVSRGKVNARKEREKRDSIYLVDINSPKDSFMKRINETLSYFRAQLKDEEARLLNLCSDWLDYLNTLNCDVISENAGPMVNAAIGVTNLLISKKMKKFAQLIERCEETVTTNKFDNVNIADLDDSLKPVQTQDLDGFWCIIRQQIEDLEKRFNNLARWRENDWNDPDFLQPNKTKERTKNNIIRKKKNGAKSEVSGNIKLKEAIQRMRTERLKERQDKSSGLNGFEEIFELSITSEQKGCKSSNAVEVMKQKSAKATTNNTLKRRSASQRLNSVRRNSTPCSSRKSTRKCDKITPRMQFEDYDLISITKTPEQSFPRKSILKTPGTVKKNYNVLFHERIAEFKSPELSSLEGRLSLGKTRGSTKRKRVLATTSFYE